MKIDENSFPETQRALLKPNCYGMNVIVQQKTATSPKPGTTCYFPQKNMSMSEHAFTQLIECEVHGLHDVTANRHSW